MTATTTAARDHARSQAGQHDGPMPIVPASAWPNPPAGVDADALVWAETVPGGRYTSKVLARGTRLRLTDLDGRGCAHLMLWRADAPWERLNIADTVKVPWQAYLGVDHPLLDDQGRVLATIVADTSGRHDALCGTTTAVGNTARYGDGSVHSGSPAGRELLTLAALKHGLDPRDVAPTVSFFHGVRADEDGTLVPTGNAGPGASVELLLHLPLIVAVANTAHPLDESPTFDTTTIELLAWRAPADLAALAARAAEIGPEYDRAHRNTEDVHAAALPTEGNLA
ncbi:urea amidolyase associated protein UAAP1 [Rhodococcus sp. NPDC003382]